MNFSKKFREIIFSKKFLFCDWFSRNFSLVFFNVQEWAQAPHLILLLLMLSRPWETKRLRLSCFPMCHPDWFSLVVILPLQVYLLHQNSFPFPHKFFSPSNQFAGISATPFAPPYLLPSHTPWAGAALNTQQFGNVLPPNHPYLQVFFLHAAQSISVSGKKLLFHALFLHIFNRIMLYWFLIALRECNSNNNCLSSNNNFWIDSSNNNNSSSSSYNNNNLCLIEDLKETIMIGLPKPITIIWKVVLKMCISEYVS